MKLSSRTWLLIAGATIIVLLLASPTFRSLFSTARTAGPSAGDSRRLPVGAIVVVPRTVTDGIRATGTILADEEVELRSEASGKVVRITFREGSRVTRGTLLLKIDDSELQAQILKLGSQQKLAEDKEQRRRQLLERQNISPEDYDIALNELNAIKAEVQLFEARIAKTEIRAPFDGIIGLRFVSEGSYVSPSTRIASLQGVNAVRIDFSVPERYARDVRRGQRIVFTLVGGTEYHSGSIDAIEPKIDPETRTVLLRARAPNPGGRIMPGAFAQVELALRVIPEALMVPSEALVPDVRGQKVYIYRNGLAEERRVETGLRTDSSVHITAGLLPLDTVITSGILQLVPGLPVSLTSPR